MNDVEKNIRKYFQDQDEAPDLTQGQIDHIHNQILLGKRLHRRRILKFVLIGVCLVLTILSCTVIPLACMAQKPTDKSTKYYTDSTANQQYLEYDYVSNYIETNYPKYNFLFADCQTSAISGYYDDDNNLLALNISFEKNEVPFSSIEFILVVQKNFNYSNYKSFVESAEIITNDHYTLYKTFNETFYNTTINGLFQYKKYDLYLKIDRSDFDYFEKFL